MKISVILKNDPVKIAKRIAGDCNAARRAGMVNWLADVESVAVKTAPKKTSNLGAHTFDSGQ